MSQGQPGLHSKTLSPKNNVDQNLKAASLLGPLLSPIRGWFPAITKEAVVEF
jgi:hypothetical protein